ncbi:WD40/YVTN/BNR-like repeat-containing protein [Natrinema gelatinilyticum]|uniref:WD40/YVTN/BNR-like repeat-containing protein n=1 Tax=Natrinema gelatinilyticum TaxID=2961571 RepID=UPI0020C4FEF0|nr:YCF48-related protein [Natrinema gelatinilyticum]
MTADRHPSRRRLLASVGTAVASLTLAGCGSADSEWVAADVPTDATLYDVVPTAEGAYAVGEDGIVLARDDGDWTVALENGLSDTGDGLRTAAVTSNGQGLWVAGDSGALGLYDVVADHVADFSAPLEKTTSWTAIAAAGLAGDERLTAINSSGELLRGRRQGATVKWGDVSKPGSGSSVTDVDLTSLAYGYIVDTDGGVFESRDGGVTWTQIGIEGAGVDFAAVAATDTGHVTVAGGNGAVYGYNGVNWSRATLSEQPIAALARNRDTALAVSSAGTIYERSFDGWEPLDRLRPGNELHAVALGTARSPQLVVGESGTVLERRY